MKKKVVWFTGLGIVLLITALLWKTITGVHGLFLQILGIAGLFVLVCLYFGICVTLTFEGDPTFEVEKKPEKKKKELTQEQSVNIARVLFFPITGMVHMAKFQHQRRVNKRKRDIQMIDNFHWYW